MGLPKIKPYIFPGAGGGGLLNKVLYLEAPSQGKLHSLFYNILERKGTPFFINFLLTNDISFNFSSILAAVNEFFYMNK